MQHRNSQGTGSIYWYLFIIMGRSLEDGRPKRVAGRGQRRLWTKTSHILSGRGGVEDVGGRRRPCDA